MEITYNNQEQQFTIVTKGLAENQVFLNSLQAYERQYSTKHWDKENSKWKETYNIHHHELIQEMIDKAMNEYLKD